MKFNQDKVKITALYYIPLETIMVNYFDHSPPCSKIYKTFKYFKVQI